MSRREISIRIGYGKLEVCPHISLNAEEHGRDERCHYIESMRVYCRVCKQTYKREVLVG